MTQRSGNRFDPLMGALEKASTCSFSVSQLRKEQQLNNSSNKLFFLHF